MEMTSFSSTRSNEKPISTGSSADWQKEYAEYLATKEESLEANTNAVHKKNGEEDWAVQYDQYLQKKYEAYGRKCRNIFTKQLAKRIANQMREDTCEPYMRKCMKDIDE